MLAEIFSELKENMTKAREALQRELAKVRTGRANPDILNNVKVAYYGVPTPLSQAASISVPEPRMLAVKPFDKSLLQDIERAIVEANLGLNPQNDGELIRLPIPTLTEDRRKELVKVAKKNGEDCKIAIRKARHDTKDTIDLLEKDGEIGKDEAERARKELEELVKQGTLKVDSIVEGKEKDILSV